MRLCANHTQLATRHDTGAPCVSRNPVPRTKPIRKINARSIIAWVGSRYSSLDSVVNSMDFDNAENTPAWDKLSWCTDWRQVQRLYVTYGGAAKLSRDEIYAYLLQLQDFFHAGIPAEDVANEEAFRWEVLQALAPHIPTLSCEQLEAYVCITTVSGRRCTPQQALAVQNRVQEIMVSCNLNYTINVLLALSRMGHTPGPDTIEAVMGVAVQHWWELSAAAWGNLHWLTSRVSVGPDACRRVLSRLRGALAGTAWSSGDIAAVYTDFGVMACMASSLGLLVQGAGLSGSDPEVDEAVQALERRFDEGSSMMTLQQVCRFAALLADLGSPLASKWLLTYKQMLAGSQTELATCMHVRDVIEAAELLLHRGGWRPHAQLLQQLLAVLPIAAARVGIISPLAYASSSSLPDASAVLDGSSETRQRPRRPPAALGPSAPPPTGSSSGRIGMGRRAASGTIASDSSRTIDLIGLLDWLHALSSGELEGQDPTTGPMSAGAQALAEGVTPIQKLLKLPEAQQQQQQQQQGASTPLFVNNVVVAGPLAGQQQEGVPGAAATAPAMLAAAAVQPVAQSLVEASLPLLKTIPTRRLPHLLHMCALLHCSPGPAWTEEFFTCIVAQSTELSGYSLLLVLRCTAALHLQPAHAHLDRLFLHHARMLDDMCSEDYVMMLEVWRDLRYVPARAVLDDFFECAKEALSIRSGRAPASYSGGSLDLAAPAGVEARGSNHDSFGRYDGDADEQEEDSDGYLAGGYTPVAGVADRQVHGGLGPEAAGRMLRVMEGYKAFLQTTGDSTSAAYSMASLMNAYRNSLVAAMHESKRARPPGKSSGSGSGDAGSWSGQGSSSSRWRVRQAGGRLGSNAEDQE